VKISLPAPHVSFIPKNPIFAFSSKNFWFLETKVGLQGKKKSVYRNRIFYEGQNRKLKE
jgi:hypothetical protein